MAVAVQIGKTNTRLIIASNDTLPDSTITHLEEIWSMLKQLSKDFQDYNGVPGSSASPSLTRTKDLGEDRQTRVHNLRRRILRFSHLRLRQRVLKNYSNAISIDRDLAKELGLEHVITQLKTLKLALDKRSLMDSAWDYVWAVLIRIRYRLHKSFETIKNYENTPLIPFRLFRYLSKIVSIIQDTANLVLATYTPGLKEILRRDFEIVNLKGSGEIPSNLPKSRAAWTELVEDILRRRNKTAKEKGAIEFVLNEIDVQQHVEKMCTTPLRNPKFVHCELNIVSYILQSSEQGFVSYIGVSKLCCVGCFHFIRAVECVLGHRFRVQVKSRKFQYPWAFPDIPHASSVAEQMRNTLSFVFGRTYDGFRPENKRYLSDSETTSVGELSEEEVELASDVSRALVPFQIFQLNQVKRARAVAKRARRV